MYVDRVLSLNPDSKPVVQAEVAEHAPVAPVLGVVVPEAPVVTEEEP